MTVVAIIYLFLLKDVTESDQTYSSGWTKSKGILEKSYILASHFYNEQYKCGIPNSDELNWS